MVFGVVTQSGGALTIESTPGMGTSVHLLLRRVSAEALPSSSVNPIAGKGSAELTGRTILLIDDDERVREVMSDTLTEAGAEVTSAANGESGLELFDSVKPDLIVVDFAMPGINGAEVARAGASDRRQAPGADRERLCPERDAAEVTGPDVSLLKKPFHNNELLEAAERLLSRKR